MINRQSDELGSSPKGRKVAGQPLEKGRAQKKSRDAVKGALGTQQSATQALGAGIEASIAGFKSNDVLSTAEKPSGPELSRTFLNHPEGKKMLRQLCAISGIQPPETFNKDIIGELREALKEDKQCHRLGILAELERNESFQWDEVHGFVVGLDMFIKKKINERAEIYDAKLRIVQGWDKIDQVLKEIDLLEKSIEQRPGEKEGSLKEIQGLKEQVKSMAIFKRDLFKLGDYYKASSQRLAVQDMVQYRVTYNYQTLYINMGHLISLMESMIDVLHRKGLSTSSLETKSMPSSDNEVRLSKAVNAILRQSTAQLLQSSSISQIGQDEIGGSFCAFTEESIKKEAVQDTQEYQNYVSKKSTSHTYVLMALNKDDLSRRMKEQQVDVNDEICEFCFSRSNVKNFKTLLTGLMEYIPRNRKSIAEMVRFLLKKGADPNKKDSNGKLLIDIVVEYIWMAKAEGEGRAEAKLGINEKTCMEILDILLEYPVDVHQSLIFSSQYGYVDIVKKILDAKKGSGCDFDINARYEQDLSSFVSSSRSQTLNLTALHAAAFSGHKDIVELLLKHGADSSITAEYVSGEKEMTIADKLRNPGPWGLSFNLRENPKLVKQLISMLEPKEKDPNKVIAEFK